VEPSSLVLSGVGTGQSNGNPSGLAVDGNASPVLSDGSCSDVAATVDAAWWVDLGDWKKVTGIRITTTSTNNGPADFLTGFTVCVGSQPLTGAVALANQAQTDVTAEYTFTSPATGQIVSIMRPGKRLILCDVQIIGGSCRGPGAMLAVSCV
jgi:hypothetical protein